MTKTIFTLNIGDYAPEIRAITRPWLEYYANKIEADIFDITERRFPEFPVTYEKLQIWEIAQTLKSDWYIYIDSDALINPETPDFTNHLNKDTVAHNGRDYAGIRWTYDRYFRRDGRNIGSCNWLTIASDWCLDLWTPLDIPLERALANIRPIIDEHMSGECKDEHLIDDYTLSRNIARFGLKFTTLTEIMETVGFRALNERCPFNPFFYHIYNISNAEKARRMLILLSTNKREPAIDRDKLRWLRAKAIEALPEADRTNSQLLGQITQDAANKSIVGVGWGLWGPKLLKQYLDRWGWPDVEYASHNRLTPK